MNDPLLIETVLAYVPLRFVEGSNIHCVPKNGTPPPPYIWNNSAKNEPILIIFGAQNPYEILRKKIAKIPHLARIVSLHYLVKCILSDAACRIVDHTHTQHTSTGSCQSHPLITREDYYNFD